MKKIVSFSLIIFIMIFAIYKIRTLNIVLGSNTQYYKTIFDYPETEWICENPKIDLKVYNVEDHPELEYIGFMCPAIVKISGNDNELMMTGYIGNVEIFNPEHMHADKGGIVNAYSLFSGHVQYKKNIHGEVTSFTISDIRKDELFDFSYKSIKFKRK